MRLLCVRTLPACVLLGPRAALCTGRIHNASAAYGLPAGFRLHTQPTLSLSPATTSMPKTPAQSWQNHSRYYQTTSVKEKENRDGASAHSRHDPHQTRSTSRSTTAYEADHIQSLMQDSHTLIKSINTRTDTNTPRLLNKINKFMLTAYRVIKNHVLRRQVVDPVVDALCRAGLPIGPRVLALYVRAREDLIRSIDDAVGVLNGPVFYAAAKAAKGNAKVKDADLDALGTDTNNSTTQPPIERHTETPPTITPPYCTDIYVLNAFITCLSRHGSTADTITFAKTMPAPHNAFTYALIMNLHLRQRDISRVCALFREYRNGSVTTPPVAGLDTLGDSHVYSVYINALIQFGLMGEVTDVMGDVRGMVRVGENPFFMGVVLHAQCVAGNVDAASEIFEALVKKQAEIEKRVKGSDASVSNDGERLEGDDTSSETPLDVTDTEIQGTIHSLSDTSIDIRTSVGVSVWQGVLTGVSRREMLPLARRAFNILLRNAYYYPPVKAYTLMISACTRCGQPDLADAYFDQMQATGIRPNRATYTAIIDAHIKTTHDTTRLRQLETEMRERGFYQSIVYATQRIQKAIRDRDLRGARDAFESMGDPDGQAYCAMVHAVLFLVDDAVLAFEEVDAIYRDMCDRERERKQRGDDNPRDKSSIGLTQSETETHVKGDLDEDMPVLDPRRNTSLFLEGFFWRIVKSSRYTRDESLVQRWLDRAKTHGIPLGTVYMEAALFYVHVKPDPARVESLFGEMKDGGYGVRTIEHDRVLVESYLRWMRYELNKIRQMGDDHRDGDGDEGVKVEETDSVPNMVDETAIRASHGAVMHIWRSRSIDERVQSSRFCEAMFSWCLSTQQDALMQDVYGELRAGGRHGLDTRVYESMVRALLYARRGDEAIRVLERDVVMDGVEPSVEMCLMLLDSVRRRNGGMRSRGVYRTQRYGGRLKFSNACGDENGLGDAEERIWRVLGTVYPQVARSVSAANAEGRIATRNGRGGWQRADQRSGGLGPRRGAVGADAEDAWARGTLKSQSVSRSSHRDLGSGDRGNGASSSQETPF